MAKAKTIRLEISDSGIRHDAEERSLIERLQGGDQAAFQTLWRRVERRVTGTANRMLRNGPEVDDVVSYVAQKVWGKISSFRFESSFSTWVCRIAVRRCLTELGRRKRNQER